MGLFNAMVRYKQNVILAVRVVSLLTNVRRVSMIKIQSMVSAKNVLGISKNLK